VRARAEGLGVQIKSSGFMQRPERVALLGAGTALSPVLEVFLAPADPHPPHRLAIVAIVLIGIGSHASAIQRLVALLRSTGAGGAGSRSLAARPLKSALTNAVATAADFLIASALFYLWYVHPPVATGAGCAVGAIVSFVLSRAWAFQATDAPAFPQLVRYGAVSLSTMVLNAGGVALLLLLDLPFVVAWCVARLAIFATWSYPVQRDFVFAGGPRHAPAPIADPEPSGASRF
jgi:putative flippase GtrA